MNRLLVEIKAHCPDAAPIRSYLEGRNADFRGVDRQVDTYFINERGRLKLREGTIENSLIYYERNDQPGPKDSHVSLCRFRECPPELREVLATAMGVKVVVDKRRAIYFIDNVKFHLDEVESLGSFVEIEAIGRPGVDDQKRLLAQCQFYLDALGIPEANLIDRSYSDLILQQDA